MQVFRKLKQKGSSKSQNWLLYSKEGSDRTGVLDTKTENSR
jgi:hypothetical protein